MEVIGVTDKGVTSESVQKAMAIFDAMGTDEAFNHFWHVSGKEIQRAESYFIRHEGQDYDMKAIVRVARGLILDDMQEIHGQLDKSDVVARWLKSLHFEIVHFNGADAPACSQEGGKHWIEQQRSERDPRLAKKAKRRNAERNGGRIKCEVCGFQDKDPAMFDAHHLRPLWVGKRDTRVGDLAVLCPTCHRWSHQKADDRLRPLPVKEVCRTRRLCQRKRL